jgi:hypothetical protein
VGFLKAENVVIIWLQSKLVEGFVVVTCIWEVHGLKFDCGISNCHDFGFYSLHPGKCWVSLSDYSSFFASPYVLIIL